MVFVFVVKKIGHVDLLEETWPAYSSDNSAPNYVRLKRKSKYLSCDIPLSNSSQKNKHALHTLLAVTQVRQFLRLKACACLPKQNLKIYRFFRILQFMSFTMIFSFPRFSVKQRAQEDFPEGTFTRICLRQGLKLFGINGKVP